MGVAYRVLGKLKEALEYLQQSLEIQSKVEYGKIGDRRGEANAWFNLGGVLVDVNRKSDALGAYRNARELYQTMGLDANVQLCNNAIERLSQPQTLIVPRRGFSAWLRRLWRWVRAWFRRLKRDTL